MTILERKFINLIPQVSEILTRISEHDEFDYFLVEDGLINAVFQINNEIDCCNAENNFKLPILDLYNDSLSGRVDSNFKEIVDL